MRPCANESYWRNGPDTERGEPGLAAKNDAGSPHAKGPLHVHTSVGSAKGSTRGRTSRSKSS